jgi:hypothetical protein
VSGTTYNYNNIFDTWNPQFDFDGDGVADPPPYTGLPNTMDGVGATYNGAPHPYWTASTPYTVGTIVIPPAPATSTSAPPPTQMIHGYQYVCVSPGTSGTTSPFQNSDVPSAPPQSTYISDGTAQWICQPPVQAIQITVKYLDPTQNLLRQVTIVQSLTQ